MTYKWKIWWEPKGYLLPQSCPFMHPSNIDKYRVLSTEPGPRKCWINSLVCARQHADTGTQTQSQALLSRSAAQWETPHNVENQKTMRFVPKHYCSIGTALGYPGHFVSHCILYPRRAHPLPWLQWPLMVTTVRSPLNRCTWMLYRHSTPTCSKLNISALPQICSPYCSLSHGAASNTHQSKTGVILTPSCP